MHALSGVRVLEVGELVGAPYAAKLLADLGADVIKVEPPDGDRARRRGPFPPHAPGDPEQSGLFLGLNANKKSVVLSLDDASDRDTLASLVAAADIVFHDLGAERAAAAGLDGATLLARHPWIVVCAITPFGQTGPHAGWSGEELNVVHGGGWGWLIPGDEPDPTAPPLTVFGYPAHCQAAMAAAFASLGFYFESQRTGAGDFIDMGVMAHVASMLEASFIAWSYLGQIAGRSGGRILNPWRIYECSDGLIFLVTVEADQWDRLVDMMGRPEWALLEVFATHADRAANYDLLNIYIEEWTRQHRVDELFHEGQKRRICFAPVFTMADLAGQDHLHQRGFFRHLHHPVAGELTYMGAPYKMTPERWELRSAAPMLGEHNGCGFTERDQTAAPTPGGGTLSGAAASGRPRRPLEGVRVVDFSWVWAGPFATMHLAHLGAEVIKIECAERASLGRRLPIHPPDVAPTLNTCGYFNQWDQGKKSVALDLTVAADRATALELVATADIVFDNYATGVMDRLGLSDEVLRAANPNVVLASITGYGHTGPLREYMGYGPTTAPLSGIASMTGHPGGRPEEAGISFGDPAAGLTAAFAAMAALVARQQGDDPARIDVSLWEATAVNTVDAWMGHALGCPPQVPIGSRHPTAAPHGLFRCAGDDAWVSIACMTDAQWLAIAELIGDERACDPQYSSSAGRKANETEVEHLLGAWTADRDRWDITRRMQGVGVAAYPSLNCAELEVNEQLVARHFWERFEHPEVGRRTHSGVPWRTLRAPNGVMCRAPLLGEHTAEVLGSR